MQPRAARFACVERPELRFTADAAEVCAALRDAAEAPVRARVRFARGSCDRTTVLQLCPGEALTLRATGGLRWRRTLAVTVMRTETVHSSRSAVAELRVEP